MGKESKTTEETETPVNISKTEAQRKRRIIVRIMPKPKNFIENILESI